MNFESVETLVSGRCPGVKYQIRRVTFRRRMELVGEIRKLAERLEFLAAGKDLKDQIDAALVAGEVDEAYLRWGLASIEGLEVDGKAASTEILLADGPEELVQEIVAAIKSRLSLSEEERKN